MNCRKCVVWTVIGIVAVAAAVAGILYRSIVPGGSVARGREPPAIEVAVAQWLLHRSVPDEFRQMKNPFTGAADAVAGRDLYRRKCEICHAYDGTGKTDIGAGQYPRPPDLRRPDIQTLPDGEIFYHIRNGIRHTGMPGWGLPDEQVWRLVAYLHQLPRVASPGANVTLADAFKPTTAEYVGSAACKVCHADLYARWSKTRMANVVRDPREHPDAIIPDLAKMPPPVKFTADEVAFVYGSRWKQRYFKKIGDDYFPLPAQWDVTHKAWKPYHVANGTDWWVKFYPEDNFQRPTGPLCDGCHSVNYDIETKKVTEWNVGCERCHGPGAEHVKRDGHGAIANPSKMNYVEANDVCVQCHSQGQPITNPIKGKYYDWPVGFHVGINKLSDVWKLEEHKLGEQTFTHFPDGTAHKNRMQGNDFVQSLMYARGVTCFSCHDVHGTEHDAVLWKPAKSLCMDCHGPESPNGPHAPTIEQHTHHKSGSAGNECIECHMPKIEQTIGDVNVRSHTFHFVTPASTESLKIPNACNVCHKDKSPAWAAEALKGWGDRSPWRMQN
ncbi:MAG: c-type cytochrome [Betaproteobacteria bacterium]